MSAATDCPFCGAADTEAEARCPSCGAILEAVPFEGVSALFTAAGLRQSIFESRTFLFLCFLGLSPLVLASLSTSEAIVDALAIWTGLCWGILLFRLFAPAALGIGTALAVLVGTALLVSVGFDAYLALWPDFETWFKAPSLALRFIAYAGVVGVREELFKAVPVAFALWRLSALRRPRAGVVLGMMAGVGFAASENVVYVYSTIQDAMLRSNGMDPAAMLMPVYNNLIRTVVGPFAHASFTGVLGAFLAVAIARGGIGMGLSGFALAALLHGAYDTVVEFSGLLGVVVLGVSLFLAMVLHAGAQEGSAAPDRGEGLFSRTIMRPLPEPAAASPARRSAPARVPPERPVPQTPPAMGSAWAIRDATGRSYPVPPYVPLKIGRDSTACHIVIDEASVSRLHATVGVTAGRLEVIRLSRIGTLVVGGREVESAILSRGDEILIGGAVLTVTGGPRLA